MSSEPIVTEPIVTEPIVVSNEAVVNLNVDNVDLKASLKAEIKAELKAELNESTPSPSNVNVESQPVESASETTSCLDVVGNMLKKETPSADKKEESVKVVEVVEVVPEVQEKPAEKPFVSSLATILTVCGKALQKDVHIKSDNLIVILHSIMEAIESLKLVKTLPALTSEQKKQLCIDCLKWLVNHQSDLSENEKAALLILVESIAPNAIDIIISVSNGASELVLLTVKRIAPCFPCENKCCVM
jgi:hypothetical protein